MPIDRARAGADQKLSASGQVQQLKPDEPTVSSRSMHYASLHHHTTYSFLDGFGLPKDHAEAAAINGAKHLAVTEHGNVSSHAQHAKACEERDIHPIFGCELYTAPVGVVEPTQKNPMGMSRSKNHLTVLASDQEGYKNLMRMVSESWSDGFFQYPTVVGKVFNKYHKGLIVLSGCTASLLATSLIGGKNIKPDEASYERARDVASTFRDMLGDRYYLEVQQMPELEDVCQINQAYERLSDELGIPLVATADVHVPTRQDSGMRPIMHAIGRGRESVSEMGQEWDYTVDGHMPESDRSVWERLISTGLSKKAAKQAILATEEIAERCQAELPTMPMVRYPLPKNTTAKKECWKLLRKGWKYRGINRLPKAEQDQYVDRLKHEMKVIESKDYIDYFLIVSDMTIWAKENGILVGPARGSAAASLVCYLLRITEVNPMEFPHLMFERFIDVTRQDLPDIDLDFDDEQRYRVFDYMREKYGDAYTGKVCTVTKYKSKNALDDIGRVHNIPKHVIESIKGMMIERSSGDLRSSDTIEDTIASFEQAKQIFDEYPDLYKSMDLEGNIKGLGIHAAGLIVSTQPITDVCAVYSSRDGSESVISFDKYSSEEMGLLKIDILGLREMSILSACLRHTGMSFDDLYNIPLDDPKTIQGFKDCDLEGIFQFKGHATKLVSNILRPSDFLEVCDVNALARPGPLHNGAETEYAETKSGEREPRRFHPMVDSITENTKFQIVYQEQILRICMEVGGFDWTSIAQIRRIISRRMGEQEFNRQGEKFLTGALKNGMSEEVAGQVWGAMITAGAYAFNYAHTVSYGKIAWWTMWFKQHHPVIFYASSLSKRVKDKEETQYLLRDAVKHGIKVLPPDPNKSGINWRVHHSGKAIRAGFVQIPGIGDVTAEEIIRTRKGMGKFKKWDDLLKVKGIGPVTLKSMLEFVNQKDPFGIYELENAIKDIKSSIRSGDLDLPMPRLKANQMPILKSQVPKNNATVWVGRPVKISIRDLFEMNVARTGIPLDPSEVKDPDKSEWAIMWCEDTTGRCGVIINRWMYPKYRNAIHNIKVGKDLILVTGKMFNGPRVYANRMWILEP